MGLMTEDTQTNSLVHRARSQLSAGRTSSALRAAWDGVELAFRQGDRDSIVAARDIAVEILEVSEGRQSDEALRLAEYCQACLDGAGGGIKARSLLGMMFRRH